jgi:hypothetical protein
LPAGGASCRGYSHGKQPMTIPLCWLASWKHPSPMAVGRCSTDDALHLPPSLVITPTTHPPTHLLQQCHCHLQQTTGQGSALVGREAISAKTKRPSASASDNCNSLLMAVSQGGPAPCCMWQQRAADLCSHIRDVPICVTC